MADEEDQTPGEAVPENGRRGVPLTARERKVLEERFGIDVDRADPKLLRRQFDVTRARIRAIEAKALRRLGLPPDPRDPD